MITKVNTSLYNTTIVIITDGCKKILSKVLGEKSDWQIGKTKVFIKDSQDALLDSFREQMLTK